MNNETSVGKSRIVDELGEQALLLPARVNEALAANDRAKYVMTLLQTAKAHADHPEQETSPLRRERLACRVPNTEFDQVVEQSRAEQAGLYHIPQCATLHDQLIADIRRMIVPLSPPDRFAERLRLLERSAPALVNDRMAGAYIDHLAAAQRQEHDSLHLLVMDLHKELNQLQQLIASELIDGASVYGIQDADRPLIAAFMAGVNQTRALKFDHPGLGTTATRSGGVLVIQNDIGTTDAHVLVVHVEKLEVRLTYTDIHLDRLVFFQSLFAAFPVHWEDTRSRRSETLEEGLYHLCLGTCTAPDPAGLMAYLRHLGSRLVFLIDWNRARKRLRKFARRRVCLAVLRWAADNNIGHRGFLTLGGDQLIFGALQYAGPVAMPMGEQLADVLGEERVAEFLKFVLKTSTEGLLAGRSEFLIRDEISAELRHYLATVQQGFLNLASEHASLIVELAMAARDAALVLGQRGESDFLGRAALRAQKWEHAADDLVKRSRTTRQHAASGQMPPALVELADDAADKLEEAIFLLALLADHEASGIPQGPVSDLAGHVVQGAQEYLKAIENARQLQQGAGREPTQDFLEAVDRILTTEHQTDAAHRAAQAGILSFSGDFKQLHLYTAIAGNLEEATDVLMHAGLMLRDFVLNEVLIR